MKSMKYDILSVQERAMARKAEGHDVINGCVGMLFEDDKRLCVYEDVNRKIEADFRFYLSYPAVLGSADYREGVLSWLFKERKREIEDRFAIPFGVTLGGTGALFMVFSLFAKKDGILLSSDIRWPNYDTIADQAHLPFSTYRLLSEKGRLDIPSLKEAIEKGLQEHENVLVLVNDPCQNPIGYCMDRKEYEELFDLLSRYGDRVSLLMDIAYVDYAPEGFLFLQELLSRKEVPFGIYVCFSASKSFGLYGLRLGALFALLDKKKDISTLLEEMKRIARGTYSCANNGAMGPVSSFFRDEEAKKAVQEKITAEGKRIHRIGTRMAQVLDDLQIEHFPYKGGFYLTFTVKDPIGFCQKLEAKDIFFAPIDESHVRIAVSGLNLEEIEEFERRMHA